MQVDEVVAKLEAATVGSTDLDRLVGREAIWPNWRAVVGPGSEVETGDRGFVRDARAADYLPAMPKPYTTSLDAALTLCPERGGLGLLWRIILERKPLHSGPAWIAEVREHAKDGGGAVAHTPALALCIAALKARSTS